MTERVSKDIFAFINTLPPSAIDAVAKLSKQDSKDYKILVVRDVRTKNKASVGSADYVVDVDFTKPIQIARALLPYEKRLKAITCRGEWNIARFVKVIPHVAYLRTPTTESLSWASDKYEMRKRLNVYDPKHTPKFTWVKNNSKKERLRVIDKVKFPMVVKPANLAASALVSICYHEDELEQTLKKTFRKVKGVYKKDGRIEEPKIIAEEYMEGQMYSVDSYVNSRGAIFHCPPVRVKTGRDIGHDDFYNYLRITPTKLKKETVDSLQQRVEQSIKALGLRSTTAHTELLLIDGDWKVIELGPRIGGFRQVLHDLSCGIDHGLNDLLIRIPRKPLIPKKCNGFAAAMRYYPDQEGVITEIKGIKKITELESVHTLNVKLKVGDKSAFAKHGGGGVFDLVLYNQDRSKLLADIRRVEQMVQVEVISKGKRNVAVKKPKAIKKKVTTQSVTKTTKKRKV